MKLKALNKNVQIENRLDIVRFQILAHCYINRIELSPSELECISRLALRREYNLAEFCELIVEDKIFKNTQTVRNCLSKLEKDTLLIKKSEDFPRKIYLNPEELQVIYSGNTMLNYKFIYLESQEIQRSN